MTFEEWLESDEGVLRFGLELRPDWIADARIGWNAAIEAAASVCDGPDENDGSPDTWDWHAKDYAKAIRALSSNAALTGERGE